MRALATALILLFSVSVSAEEAHDRDILWLIRSADYIDTLAQASRLGRGIRGLAWYSTRPCVVMTLAPPVESAPEREIRFYLKLLNHELRHCRERKNFHRDDQFQARKDKGSP